MATATSEATSAAATPGRKNRAAAIPAANRPSLHVVLLGAIAALAAVAYAAVYMSGEIKGYEPSLVIAARDMLLYVPVAAVFVWLVRGQKFKGSMTLYTAAIVLFTVGMVVQYRLFRDPEYGVRVAAERREAREAKSQKIRYDNIRAVYDDEKKLAVFGTAEVPERPVHELQSSAEHSFLDAITSVNTFIPIVALLAFCLFFRFFRSDNFLLWLQRHALMIALVTLLPFAIVVVAFSSEGKFLGQTTPWEPVKIVFLVSFAAMLADTYRHLGRTRWGLPPARFALPFAVVASLPVIPFFALSDFGQMLVFFGVYVSLYLIAVRKNIQVVYAMALTALLGAFAYFVVGLPGRVNLRFHLWLDTWNAPAEDALWWAPRLARIREQYGFAVSNQDAWYDQASQLAQGLFGISDGGTLGDGLGLGYPEIVPVSDSDFIYAAIGEELGMVGGALILLATAALVLAGTRAAIESRDMFTKLVAAGFTGFIGFQALVNIGGVIRMLPMTGITLPFVSHGGWSLITSFAMLGVLMAITHRNASPAPPTTSIDPRL